MVKTEEETSESDFGVASDQGLEGLTREAKIQALKDAITILAKEGYPPFSPENLPEILGPSQLRLIFEEADLSDQITEEQLETIAENIPSEDLAIALRETDSDIMDAEKSAFERLIDVTLLDYPVATLYAISLGMMMLALYISSPIVALAGVGTLLITILHYGR